MRTDLTCGLTNRRSMAILTSLFNLYTVILIYTR
jgi:hypothetical protein